VKFVDSCNVDLVAGTGGNGVVAFRREKFVPFGGPAGGDGGRGADIVFVADEGLSTLLDLTYGRTIRGDHGEHGQGGDCYGRAAKEVLVRVPVGTQVYDRASGALLHDIDEPNKRIVVARGGKGGRGNIHFATPHDRAPRRAEPGEWATGLVLAYLQIRFYEKSSTWAPTVVVRKNAIPAISMHVLTTAPGPLPHRCAPCCTRRRCCLRSIV
jgi:Obg family GTPase CgtA